MLDSPIKWMGGKSRMRKRLLALLPQDAECYCEVFAGAAWVLFAKPPHPVEVLNDRNNHLVNLWRVLKWRPAELLENIQRSLYSRTMFYELREQDPEQLDELERATWLYLLIQQSFGADLRDARRPRFGYRKKLGRKLFLNKSLYQIDPAAERLRNVFIECLDFEDCLRRYDQPRTVFFCDPPYYGTSGYAEKFGAEDHERLARALAGIEGRFLLTVNDCPETRDLYCREGWEWEGAKETRALCRETEGRQAADILIVRNYDALGVRGCVEVPALSWAEPQGEQVSLFSVV